MRSEAHLSLSMSGSFQVLLHQLKGERKGIWAVKVSGNWRVTFRFIDGNAGIVHDEDYH